MASIELRKIIGLLRTNWVLLGLIVALAVAVYAHSGVLRPGWMPTFGNSFIHIASERETLETGHYPMNDFSYGGNVPNLYVPGYRMFIAEFSALTGLDPTYSSQLAVMFYALLLAGGFFLLARALWGDIAGLFAAFFASLSPELLIYNIRPLPQSLGMSLIPVTLWLLVTNRTKAALLCTLFLSLVHQESAVFLAGVIAAYAAVLLIWRARSLPDLRKRLGLPQIRLAAACFGIAVATYFLWHFFVMGNFAITDIAQFRYHESGDQVQWFTCQYADGIKGCTTVADFFTKVYGSPMFDRLGNVNSVLAFAGVPILAWLLIRRRTRAIAALFGLAFFGAALLAVENNLLGFAAFTDRFVAYMAEPVALLAAFTAALFIASCLRRMRERAR